MNIEFDVTLQCNFSCVNCNRFSNFNSLVDPLDSNNKVGLNFYGNTDVNMEQVKKFVSEVKQHPKIDRLHIIGGEPLTHPFLDKIVDEIRNELYGKYVPNVLIISNIHPQMLKANTLDTPEEIINNFPFNEPKINLENIPVFTRSALNFIQEYLNSDGMTKEKLISELGTLAVEMQEDGNTTKYLFKSLLENSRFFHGVPVINYKPLNKKAEEHRCTLVAPYDSGQEMLEKCNVPQHCGINFSFDGYSPCSQGSAIARLFKMNKYRKSTLPKSFTEWKDIDENGYATINKDSNMWDLCKLCQIAAKKQMLEKDYGRPISISYRKALGLEKSEESVSEYVVPSHSKKLAPVPVFRKQ